MRLLVMAVLGCGLLWARAETVLVLPFFNLSKSANLDWIGESISETIRESLASERVLTLDRAERREAFRRLAIRHYTLLTRATIVKIGEALDAAYVVYGQYELDPADPNATVPSRGGLRVRGRVIDLKRIKQGPEFIELGALEDLAALETHLAWQTLQFLFPQAAPSEEEFRKARPPIRVDAIESYIRGLLTDSADQRHRFFTQAARLDTSFSEPCFQLGKIYTNKKDYRVAAGWLDRVTPADSHYLEARFLLGLCRYYLGDFAQAEEAFQLVAKSVPLNEVFNNLGAAQSRRGRPEAVANFRKALEVDSADADYYFNLGYALWKQGDFEPAADNFRAVLDRMPDDADATSLLGRCLQKNGPRPGDPKSDGLERLKRDYEETVYRQLKAELEPKR